MAAIYGINLIGFDLGRVVVVGCSPRSKGRRQMAFRLGRVIQLVAYGCAALVVAFAIYAATSLSTPGNAAGVTFLLIVAGLVVLAGKAIRYVISGPREQALRRFVE